ncbi:hypothetical protein MJO47_10775 [Desulfuromonas sp. KJ2020]|uniref:hypothetical protein n=1 Tax=Desulfuromonas sp. KJ2020 TaxID=2919173 RepID=UPI0020A7CC8F|nr:hypothetical protein [Desulfuromonas sp. KJ2020]MCP3177585.1 hypothetical protein [Desulfuromonas sp. KJ2020]
MKAIKFAIASLIFLIILLCAYYLHIKYFKVDVVFYAAIVDGVFSALTAALIICSVKIFNIFCKFEKLLMVFVWLLVGYSFAISVPTVIDRSLSFYILEKLQQRGGAIKQDAFEWIFINEYMVEHRLIDVRLTEQLESGTIEIVNGCVILTEKGRSLAGFSRYFRQHWLPRKRLLMGEYSDDLTDPFLNSQQIEDYKCQ